MKKPDNSFPFHKIYYTRLLFSTFINICLTGFTTFATTAVLPAMIASTATAMVLATFTTSFSALAATLLGFIGRRLAQLFGYGELEHVALDKLLDGSEARLVIHRHKGDGTALGTGTCRTTDTVHIILTVAGHIVVDYQWYIIHINTT